MTPPNSHVAALQGMKQFFDKTASGLDEDDAEFRPRDEMFTVAQQIAHTAQVIDWFMEGAFRPEGFDMDFESQAKQVFEMKSLSQARSWFDRAVQAAIDGLGARSAEEMAEPLPADGIMGGMPKASIVGAMADHTAHHRGALAVYTRILGKIPPMPYM